MVDGLPPQLDETIEGMLAKVPDQRFRKAEDAAFALEPFVEQEAEELVVQEVSPQYLDWIRAQQPSKPEAPPEDVVGVTPQLTQFLDWMSRKQRRRKKKSG